MKNNIYKTECLSVAFRKMRTGILLPFVILFFVSTSLSQSSQLEFDGNDDYAEIIDSQIDGLDQFTISFWFKYDGPFLTGNNRAFLMGQKDMLEIFIQKHNNNSSVYQSVGAFVYRSNGGRSNRTTRFNPANWTHFSVVVNRTATSTNFKIYLNGDFSGQRNVNNTINSSSNSFRIGALNGTSSLNDFEGSIDEIRVFNSVLSEDQIRKMVYQEISYKDGFVAGTLTKKIIEDSATEDLINWNNLIAYYPMNTIVDGQLIDESVSETHANLNGISQLKEQTAPLPFETSNDGDWFDENTWAHGDIWDIETLDEDYSNNKNPKDWTIIKINNEVTATETIESMGLIIAENANLIIDQDNVLYNYGTIDLKGTIDLRGESQLIQTAESDLISSASGKLKIQQAGNSNPYWYTYMSSPVGAMADTGLADSNTAFSLGMLKDENGEQMQFTSSLNETGKLSTAWMYSFLNGITAYDWTYLNLNSEIEAGVGYTHKGTGVAGDTQVYTFEGRPHNGTIRIAANDVDHDDENESQSNVTQTSSLIGNPYPSAIDSYKFLDDNAGVIDGTIYLWQQWDGNSHYLADYEGGYATLNKMARIRAYHFNEDSNGQGTIRPKRYIPVGQAFMVEVIEDGEIEFNNDQRTFRKGNQTVFFRNSDNTKNQEEETEIQTMTLEFSTSNGLTREIVLGFSDFTSSDYDSGYDSKMFSVYDNDMYTVLGDDKMISQAFSEITPDMEIPLVIKTSGQFTYVIKVTEFKGFNGGQEVYLRDNYTNNYFDLRDLTAYNFSSESGTFSDRFDIVFHNGDTLSNETLEQSDLKVLFVSDNSTLYVHGIKDEVRTLSVYDMSGRAVMEFNDLPTQALNDGIEIENISSGIYTVSLISETNQVLNKKIIID